MDYEEIFERMLDNQSITEEEWEFVYNVVRSKLERKEVIRAQEITEVILECAELEYVYGEPARHGWIDTNIIFTFDNENYYSFDCWWNDDRGIDGVDDQVCPKMVKKQVMVEHWVEVEE